MTEPYLVPIQSIPFPGHGTLGVAQWPDQVPFEIRRVFYVYGAPVGTRRANHAHRQQQQFLVCLTGAVQIVLEHRGGTLRESMDDPDRGLYIPPMCWVKIEIAQPGTLYLALVSGLYDEDDYIRDRSEFEALLRP